jgi:ribosome maturation factor RimP
MEWDSALAPIVAALGLELYDAEFVAGTLHVVVTRPGGVDLEALTAANRALSEWLDANDPIAGRYTLDVSSPGLERRLRTPAHFASAVGEVVRLRERRENEPTRRLEGVVVTADDTSVTIADAGAGSVVVALGAVERARTVFAWGASAPDAKRTKKVKGAAAPTGSKKG